MINTLDVQSGSNSAKALSGISVGMVSHPYVVRKLSDLAPELLLEVENLLLPTDEVRRIFVVPKQVLYERGKRRDVPELVLVFTDAGVIHVQAAAPGELSQAHRIQTDQVLCIEVALILLYGRIEILSATNGQVLRTVVEFNAVGWQMLQATVQAWLTDISGGDQTPYTLPDTDTVSRIEIEQLPYKFVSGVDVYLLAPGEQLQALVYQPDRWENRYGLFRHQLTPPLVVALTDRYLSCIEERRAVGRSNSYGWIFSFIPRNKITGIRNLPSPLGRLIEFDVQTHATKLLRHFDLSPEAATHLESHWRPLPLTITS